MSVNLVKGQKVNLSKQRNGLSKVMVGLGWKEVKSQTFSNVSSGFSFDDDSIDCDAIAFLLDNNGKIAKKEDVVYFSNLEHFTGCVVHQGDNLTGNDNGMDAEQIMINLSRLPAEYERIIILVSIYDATIKKQHFGMIQNAYMRLVDAETNNELCIYNLSENYDGMTSLVFGEIYRSSEGWKYNAIGQPLKIWSIAQLAEKYGLRRYALGR